MPATNEVWIDPTGRPVELEYVGLTGDGEEGPDGETYEWFPESPGHLHPRTYLVGGIEFVVFPVEPWSPYDAIADILLRDGYTPPPPTEAELARIGYGDPGWDDSMMGADWRFM
jgi:hypothetical protein